MNNCTLSRDDIFFIFLKNKEETIEFFGEEYLSDYGKKLPEELILEYRKVHSDWLKVQKKLGEFYK